VILLRKPSVTIKANHTLIAIKLDGGASRPLPIMLDCYISGKPVGCGEERGRPHRVILPGIRNVALVLRNYPLLPK